MNQKETEALCAELEYRQQPTELNPQILKNVFKETSLKPDLQVDILNFWRKIRSLLQQSLEWIWKQKIEMSFATSVLVAVVVLLRVIPLEPQPKVKSPLLIPQQIVVSNPQATAQTLQTDLAKLDIVATLKTLGEVWIVEVVNLSTDNPEDLSALLTKHELVLPPPSDESGLKIRIVAKSR